MQSEEGQMIESHNQKNTENEMNIPINMDTAKMQNVLAIWTKTLQR